MSGWGDWAGPSISKNTTTNQKKTRALQKKLQVAQEAKLRRKDSHLSSVLISESRVKSVAKFKLSDLPFPFVDKGQYERSIQLPVGGMLSALLLHLLILSRGMECKSCSWSTNYPRGEEKSRSID